MIKPTKKRLKRLGIVAFFCAIPILFRVWIEKRHAESQKLTVLDTLDSFYFEDQKEQSFTQVDLHNTLNFLVISKCKGSCTKLQSAMAGLDRWVSSNFTYSGQKDPLHTVTLLSASSEVLMRTPSTWKSVAISPEKDLDEIQKFIPKSLKQQLNEVESFIAVVTGKLEIVRVMDLKDFDAERIGSALSRLSFNTYLDQYLSDRTFMGPKRKISKF